MLIFRSVRLKVRKVVDCWVPPRVCGPKVDWKKQLLMFQMIIYLLMMEGPKYHAAKLKCGYKLH